MSLSFQIVDGSLPTLSLEVGLCVGLILRVALSFVVLLAGVGKMMDPAGSRQSMVDFGVPVRWAGGTSALLPLVELALGLGLLIDVTARTASFGLAVLFSVFSLGIWNLLRQNKAPACNCFGAVHSEPVSAWTLLRSLTLAGIGAALYHLPLWPLTPGLLGAALVVTAYTSCGAMLYGLSKWRQKMLLRSGPERLQVGDHLPDVRLEDGRWLVDALSRCGPTLVILTSEGCPPCNALIQKMAPWRHRVVGVLPIIELRKGAPAEERDPNVYYLNPTSFARLLSSTPAGILVGSDAGVIQPPAVGPAEVEALIKLTLESLFPQELVRPD